MAGASGEESGIHENHLLRLSPKLETLYLSGMPPQVTSYFLLSFFATIFSLSNLVFHNHMYIYIYICFDIRFLRQVLLFVPANLLADTFWPLRRTRRSSRLFWNPLSPPRFVLLWLRRGRLCGVAWEIVQRRS